MRRVTVLQDLRGTLTEIGPGLLDTTLAASDGGDARLVSQLRFAAPDRFCEPGRIDLADGDALHFRTLGEGYLAAAPDRSLRIGAAEREVISGSGALEGGTGRINSIFVVDHEGRVSDREVALVFLAGRSTR